MLFRSQMQVNTAAGFIESNVPSSFQQNVSDAFGTDVRVMTLTEDMTVYRYYGNGSNPVSYWVTPYQYANPSSSLALPPTNSVENMAIYTIPKGTTVLGGTVAPAFGQPGGGYQIYIADPTVLK